MKSFLTIVFFNVVFLAFGQHVTEVVTPTVGFSKSNAVIEIMLIRHGEPALDKTSRRSRKQIKAYIYAYDTVKVYPLEKSPVHVTLEEVDTIYTSTLVRAYDTAEKIFTDDFVILKDERFREFEREAFPLPLIPLKTKTWGVISRIPWMLGLQSSKIEGFRKGKKRAKDNANFLAQQAEAGGRTVLVAHGFLNRYIKKYLMKDGWKLSADTGKEYASVQVLSKLK